MFDAERENPKLIFKNVAKSDVRNDARKGIFPDRDSAPEKGSGAQKPVEGRRSMCSPCDPETGGELAQQTRIEE